MRFGVALAQWGASGVAEHTDDPPGPDAAHGLRVRIAAEAQEKGYELDDVGEMFAAHMGGNIRTASVPVLSEFLARVKEWHPVDGVA
jgi:hypothetical protein